MSAATSSGPPAVGTALVTGATSGIGRATALQLAREGWEVIVHGRDPERGAEVVRLIEAEGGALGSWRRTSVSGGGARRWWTRSAPSTSW